MEHESGESATRTERRTLRVDGHDRTYEVVSTDASDRRPRALLLALHGSNQDAAKLRAMSGGTFDDLASSHDAVVVYPEAYKGLWNDARTSMASPARREGIDDVAFLAAVVAAVTDDHGPLPVFVAGYSNGGQLAIRLVHERPELLSGAVLVGATQPTADVFAVARDAERPLPVVVIHGTRDPIVPYAGGTASLFGFRPRGTGLSAPDTAAYYARRNGIGTPPVVERLPHEARSGRTSVTLSRWAEPGRPTVALYTVDGGGHTVPNRRHRAFRLLGRTTHDLDAGAVVGRLIDDTDPTAPPGVS